MSGKDSDLEVTELEDADLDSITGGVEADLAAKDNEVCPTNSGNCIAGCACPPPGGA